MKIFIITSILLLLVFLTSCEGYNLSRTNPYDTKNINFEPTVAELTTFAATDITGISATCGGEVIFDGGMSVTSRGVCWNNSPAPTINLVTKTADGSGVGIFTSNLTGLNLDVQYYVRAYATNSKGTSYGNEISFRAVPGIGHNFQGGKVAYIFQPGDPGYIAGETHGIIAAPISEVISTSWGCFGIEITGAEGTILGTGKINTLNIINGCSQTGIAARFCDEFKINGYDDWYLPCKDELNKLFLNKTPIGWNNNLNNAWSSSKGTITNSVWAQNFFTGDQYNTPKNDDYKISTWPIRGF